MQDEPAQFLRRRTCKYSYESYLYPESTGKFGRIIITRADVGTSEPIMDTCTSSNAARQTPVEKHERGQVGDRLSADSWLVNAILPPDASDLVFESLQPVAAAMQECEVIQEGNEVSAFDDDELGIQVMQMLGRRCSVSFPCSSILQYLCLHVKMLDKYFSFEVEIVDDSKHYRYIDISNNRSVADIGGGRALLPLELREGWQRINIDLERIARIAFGTSYLTASQITLRASARIAKVFFQSEPFSDYELPSHLRAIAE